jgi:hypothetical protein
MSTTVPKTPLLAAGDSGRQRCKLAVADAAQSA